MDLVNPAFINDDMQDKYVTNYDSPRSQISIVNDHGLGKNDDEQYKCGYGKCTPKWLQWFHTPRWLLFFLSLCAITQGFVVNGIVPVSITNLEKRFNINSTQSGLFSAFYDISFLIILIPVCHWGNKGHKGRYLGWGMFFMGIGSLICALPQFTTGPYKFDQGSTSDTCQIGVNDTSDCDSATSSHSVRNYFYVLLFGQLFHGCGATPLYILGVTFLDESVSQNASPIYLGLFTAFATVGPAIGFVMGSFILNFYGDIGKVDIDSLNLPDKNDPRWYGAWWIGFLISACMAFLVCLPVLCFARQLPGAQRQRSKDIDQVNQIGSSGGFGENLTDLPRACLSLLRNPTYTAIIIMESAESFLLNGFVTFVPKLFENIFNFSASKASMTAGAIVVPAGFFGNLFGGIIIRKFNLRCRGMILTALIFTIISGLLAFVFIIRCPDVAFAGVSEPYLNESMTSFTPGNLSHFCNSECSCSSFYKPVCNKQLMLSYFSPCQAGCTTTLVENDLTTGWSDCVCVAERLSQDTFVRNTTVIPGLCDTSCSSVTLYLLLFGLLVFFMFCSAMPVQQAQLRCVPFRQRTLGIGFGWIFMRALGSIPGPILFGYSFDGICLLWKYECDEPQTCLRYSSHELALTVMAFGLGLKCLIAICLVAAWFLYRPPVVPSVASRNPIVANNDTKINSAYENEVVTAVDKF